MSAAPGTGPLASETPAVTRGDGLALQATPFPALDSIEGTALLGVGVVVLVWGLRVAIRRRRARSVPNGSSGARPLRSERDGLVAAHGGAPADVALTVPLPGDRQARSVRHVELYAVELGLVAGALLAWLASLASVDPLIAGLLGSTLGAVSFWRVRSMAVATVREAPRLWLGATALGAVAGWLLFF